jgi:2-polyprenyl-3-methyl-5-hydroxy-6-metoxy-1,4-benzoquinol methylase
MDIEPCNVLEIGCGTGNNSIWLAPKNFNVRHHQKNKRPISIKTFMHLPVHRKVHENK